jgi:hypothetical protein
VRLSPGRIAGMAAALVAAWLAYSPCYCFLEFNSAPTHITSVPPGCAVLDVPGWHWPDKYPVNEFWRTENPLIEQEFRSGKADLVFLGLRAPSNGSVAKEKYKFLLQDLLTSGRNVAVEVATEAEWNAAQQLSYSDMNNHTFLDPQFRGQDTFTSGSANSESGRWNAVHSYGREPMHGSAAFDFEIFPPWRTVEFAIYATKERKLIRQVKGWTCQMFHWNYLQFHGDRFFSVPLSRDARKILTCGFGE